MPQKKSNIHFTLKELKGIPLIDKVRQIPYITDEPKISSYVCFPSQGIASKYSIPEKAYGQGFDFSEDLAKIKAMAECLERICLFNPIKARLIKAQFREKTFVNPLDFCCISQEQALIIKDHCLDSEFLWYPVTEFPLERETYVPAQMVFLSHHFDQEFALRGEKISTGAAFGNNGESQNAFMRGFFEVIERDACMYAYLTQNKLRKITNLPKNIQKFFFYLERYALEPAVFDISSDLEIPCVLAVMLDRSGIGDAVNVGAKAGREYTEAILGAIYESLQCRRGSRIHSKLEDDLEDPPIDALQDIETRHKYWRRKERLEDISSWLENYSEVNYYTLSSSREVERAYSQVLKMGFHIYVADITLPEISEAGFEVKKVIIPELHPLYIDEQSKCLYSTHYGQICSDLKLKPHPFT